MRQVLQRDLRPLALVHKSKHAEWWYELLDFKLVVNLFPWLFHRDWLLPAMCLYFNPRVRKYFPILGCSVGRYFFLKLVTFWANNFIKSVMTYLPSLITIDEYKVAISSFSSSVTCLPMILLILTRRCGDTFVTVLPYASYQAEQKSPPMRTRSFWVVLWPWRYRSTLNEAHHHPLPRIPVRWKLRCVLPSAVLTVLTLISLLSCSWYCQCAL